MRRAVIAITALGAIFLGLLVYVVLYQRGEPRKKDQLFDFTKGDIAKIELTYTDEGGEKKTVLVEKRPEDDPIQEVSTRSAKVGGLIAGIVFGLGLVVGLVAAFAPPESDRRRRTFLSVALVGLAIAVLGGGGTGLLIYFGSDRVSKDYTWEILQPIKARGDNDSIDSLADNIASLTAASTFTRDEQKRLKEPDNAKEAGLVEPKIIVSAWDLKGRRLAKLAVGNSMTVGSDLYAQVNDKDFVTLGSWKVDQLKKKAGDLRDKSVVRVALDDVTGVELKYANTSIRMKREKAKDSAEGDEYQWSLTTPIQAKGDRLKCDEVVTKIKDLKVEEFIEKDQEKPLEQYGLDKPEITATVDLKDGKQEVVYISGKRDPDSLNKVYCRAKGRDEVFLVDDKVLEDLRKKPIDLRDKKICDFDTSDVEKLTVTYKDKTYVIVKKSDNEWRLEQPEKGKCDYGKVDDIRWYMRDLAADEFVADKPEEKDLYKWGLDKPQAEITAHLKKGEVKVLIGTHLEKDGQMYVKRADRPAVMLTSDTLLRYLPESPADLLEKPEAPNNNNTGT